jgi:tetratricopeptide (TPR) repeat protein
VTSTAATSLAALAAFALALLGNLAAARAQNAEAELLFRDGDRLMAAGDLAKACDAFEGSNRIEPRAGTLIRLGDCREKNQQLASAWSAYSDALSRVKDPKKREIAQAKVSGLEPRLSFLTISVPDEARVVGLTITRNGQPVDAVLWNRGAPVDGGEYVVAGRAPGHEEWSTKVTVKPEADKVAVEVPRFKELKVLTPPPGVGGELLDDDGPSGPIDAPSMLTPRRKIALGVAGVGVVALVGGALVGTQAKGLESEAHDACANVVCVDHAEANEALEDARGKARLANIGYGVAVAAGAGAAFLWLTGAPRSGDGLAISPQVGPGVAGAIVRGSF